MRKFHHIGLPTTEKQPGEWYVPETKVWSGPTHRSIEFLLRGGQPGAGR